MDENRRDARVGVVRPSGSVIATRPNGVRSWRYRRHSVVPPGHRVSVYWSAGRSYRQGLPADGGEFSPSHVRRARRASGRRRVAVGPYHQAFPHPTWGILHIGITSRGTLLARGEWVERGGGR